MVTASQKNANEFLDTFGEVARKAFDAGCNVQSAWFDAAKNFSSASDAFGGMAQPSSRAMKSWFPLMEKNFQAATEAADCCFQGGVSALKSACDNVPTDGNVDLQARTQETCERLFESARGNAEAMTAAGTKVLDNWLAFCQSAGEQAPAPKPSTKSGK